MAKAKDIYNKFSTSAKTIPAIFYIGIIIVIALWPLLDKCSSNKPSHIEDNRQNNELIKWKDSAKKANDIADKIEATLIAQYLDRADEAAARLKITDQMLSKTQKQSVISATNMQVAKQNNDTAAYIRNCDSLGNLTIDLSVQINEARDSVKNLLKIKDSLQAATDRRLRNIESFTTGMRICCDTATAKYSALYKDYKPLLRKAGKKWSLGIGGGAALGSDARFGGSVGIYVVRKLISF
jgi:hypothetical protein